MPKDGDWHIGAWAGFVCVLLAANGLVHDSIQQGLSFAGAAVLFFLWAAWLGRARH